MTSRESPSEQSEIGPFGRAVRRVKRLAGPTLVLFGLDSEGRLLPTPVEPGEGSATRAREAGEKDDHARLAIAEAEIATDRSEKRQQAESSSSPLKG